MLIRHGEAEAAVRRVVGGHTGCTGLSPAGVRQAEALRDRLARTGELAGTGVFLTSVLPRAVETAEIIGPAIGGHELVQDCELCELHPGEGDGLSWEDFESRYGRNWDVAHFQPVSPGGESRAEFAVRVGRALARVADEHRGWEVVVVCHGGVIEGSLWALGHVPLQRPFDLHIENTSITEWVQAGGGGGRWRLVRFNDAAHLAGA
ncbi:MAG: histidine phosphatase family protein [Acidimicrobiales bacterium]